ncbi:hypothetical protein [Trichlorobacter lovleyi]|uniref:hypothetical protein n=1 Tax=Trichlorobacter lovleyi TaxID=313985 RepID=UPI0023EFA3D5|nr:hypothetical protein [Trichlorobacter lovleyi]
MSKKYKNKLCIYCAQRQSVTGDHIFAREFFLPAQRANLPQVPTCQECNNEKSKLEHYLTALLPFGGRHPDASENLKIMVPPRLAKNVKLHRTLASSRDRVFIKEADSAIFQPTTALPIHPDAIEELFGLILKGLSWYHWNVYFADEHQIQVYSLTSFGEDFFENRFFKLNAASRVEVNLGNGTVHYEGIQAQDCAQITVWRFKLYGGLMLAGDPNAPQEQSTQIAAISGPRRCFDDREIKENS